MGCSSAVGGCPIHSLHTVQKSRWHGAERTPNSYPRLPGTSMFSCSCIYLIGVVYDSTHFLETRADVEGDDEEVSGLVFGACVERIAPWSKAVIQRQTKA